MKYIGAAYILSWPSHCCQQTAGGKCGSLCLVFERLPAPIRQCKIYLFWDHGIDRLCHRLQHFILGALRLCCNEVQCGGHPYLRPPSCQRDHRQLNEDNWLRRGSMAAWCVCLWGWTYRGYPRGSGTGVFQTGSSGGGAKCTVRLEPAVSAIGSENSFWLCGGHHERRSASGVGKGTKRPAGAAAGTIYRFGRT